MSEVRRYMRALLILEDGSVYRGRGFGAQGMALGEVVFNTGMVGYTEALTDPSYKGQILCFTYPLIGNYGVPPYTIVDEYGLPLHFESKGIKVEGVIVHEVCWHPSHWASTKSFHEWLSEEGIPGIYGIDTRRLVMSLREQGVMMGLLKVYDARQEEPDLDELFSILEKAPRYGDTNYVRSVSVKAPKVYRSKKGKGSLALLDCGVKLSIIRSLLVRGFDVIRLPYDSSASDILKWEPKGVVISNGPGDPRLCMQTISTIRELVDYDVPILGICLGNQLVSLALGGEVYKLPYGHRGQNKPCIDITTSRCYVTSQNHGYAVDESSLRSTPLKVWFINADDKTVEGVFHERGRILAVQFHPEASPGPNDTSWVFDLFVRRISSR